MPELISASDLLVEAERFRRSLISVSAAGEMDNEEYRERRRVLVGDTRSRSHLPKFVLSCREVEEFKGFMRGMDSNLPTYDDRRNYVREQFAEVLGALETEIARQSENRTSNFLLISQSPDLQVIWDKALDRVTVDPPGAITMSRTLLEAVCKHILEEAGVEYGPKDDLPRLYRLTADRLNLGPTQHTDEPFKRILGGCTSVVEGLGSLRNQLSDSHGTGPSAPKPSARHAQLAVQLAGGMANFLLETWQERQQSVP